MHDAGCLGLVHWDDPEGWYGEGGGRLVKKKKTKKQKKANLKFPSKAVLEHPEKGKPSY